MASSRNARPTGTSSSARPPDPRGDARGLVFSRVARALLFLVVLAFGLVEPLPAAEPARKHFVIPEAEAARALDAFSAQSTTEMFYVPDQVRGVQTKAIDGQFTDREALDRLLAGTTLRVMPDPRSGVLVIVSTLTGRAPAEKVPGAEPARGLIAALRALPEKLGLRPVASGENPAPDEVVRLNPFEVVDVKDGGFQSSSVGSGSRLALDLKDTPVAYSVINREFIEALGITDLAEAAAWATGQTFYFSDNGGDAAGRPSQYFARGALTTQGGADSFGAQRNFYQNANQGGDSYSVETYDFGRSPNAPLFGQGSGVGGDSGNGGLGGISSIQSKRAYLDRTATVVTAELGSWSYRRATLDYNRPLGERLGLRLNAVDLDQRGWRYLDMRKTRGLNLTGTFRPTGATELRLEASTEKNQSHNVGAGWDEYVSGWDGRTVFRGPITNSMLSTDGTPGALTVANASYGSFTDVTWDTAQNNPTVAPTALRQPAWVLTNWGESFVQSRYYTAQATAKYWEEKVVVTGAYRRDLNFGNSKSALPRGLLPTNWNGSDAIYRPDAPKDYFTMTYIQKNTTTGVPVTGKAILSANRPTANNAFGVPVPIAIYNGERFRDDYNNPTNRSYSNNKSYGIVWHVVKQFSLLANFADSYTPRNSITLDMDNNIRDPQKSKSRDLGFTFSLLNNRLTGKYNYYDQTRQNDSLNALTGINGLYQANDATNADNTASGRNIRNIADLPGADYQDRRNFGAEVDLAFNFNRALRFTANGTSGSYSLSNIGRLTKAYVPAHAADFLQILQDAGGMLDTSQKPVGAPNAPGLAVINPGITPALVADRDSAISNYNLIWVNFQNLVTQRTVRISLPRSANVFADYTLQTGRAKGLRIGVGVQWQKALIGAQSADTTLDPNNPIPTAIPFPGRNGDNSTRLWGNNNYVTQMNIAYAFKLKNGNPLNVSLRINNFLNDRSKIFGDNGVFGGAGFPGTTGLRQPQGNLLLPNRERQPYVLSSIHEPINARLTASYKFGNSRSR